MQPYYKYNVLNFFDLNLHTKTISLDRDFLLCCAWPAATGNSQSQILKISSFNCSTFVKLWTMRKSFPSASEMSDMK